MTTTHINPIVDVAYQAFVGNGYAFHGLTVPTSWFSAALAAEPGTVPFVGRFALLRIHLQLELDVLLVDEGAAGWRVDIVPLERDGKVLA